MVIMDRDKDEPSILLNRAQSVQFLGERAGDEQNLSKSLPILSASARKAASG
jgi:hypothetical protein